MSIFSFSLTLFFAFPTLIWAKNLPNDLGSIRCQKEISKKLSKVKSDNDWRSTFAQPPFQKAWKGPSNKIGQWILLRKGLKKEVDILIFEKGFSKQYVFDKKCKVSITKMKHKADVANSPQFTDKDLRAVLRSGKKTVIYVWSPGMVLSTNHLPKFKRLAKSQGYQFIGVSLPSVSDSVGKKSANNVGFSWKSNNRRVASLELLNRDISVHQPAVLFVVGRKIHRRTFTGVRGAKEWKRIFLKIESDLL